MSTNTQTIKETIKNYLMTEFLPDENPNDLTDTTPLVTGGILDSISTFKLVGFLHNKFDVKLNANEIANHLNTLTDITDIVLAKQGLA